MARRILMAEGGRAWRVEDSCQSRAEISDFVVRWQFGPGSIIKRRDERSFIVNRKGVALEVQLGEEWMNAKHVETPADREKLEPENPLAGTVSPAFRKTVFAPYLLLVARPRGDQPCVFRTTFLASRDS
jgi:hypothetical protein